jgi:probable F420-dependent oxidoreductase
MEKLRGTGIWSSALMAGDPTAATEVAIELEELGYTSLWVPTFGPGAFEAVERLLAATDDIVVATGILSVWLYGAEETAAAHARLVEAHGSRFLLGLGISHGPIVDMFVPGATYQKPMATMAAYLDGLDAAPTPVAVHDRVLAALGPKMLELARDRTGGAHPYNVTPEHTAHARAALGPDKVLVPEQAVALTTDPNEARRWGRSFLENYLGLPNYTNNLRRLGFTDDDLDEGGSDRLVDGLIAWGDVEPIARRVQDHLDAGADGVCIQVLSDAPMGGMAALPVEVYRELAPALCR